MCNVYNMILMCIILILMCNINMIILIIMCNDNKYNIINVMCEILMWSNDINDIIVLIIMWNNY